MPTDEELERAACCFMDALTDAATQSTPERRESTFAKPWWNAQLDEAKAALASAKYTLRGLDPEAAADNSLSPFR